MRINKKWLELIPGLQKCGPVGSVAPQSDQLSLQRCQFSLFEFQNKPVKLQRETDPTLLNKRDLLLFSSLTVSSNQKYNIIHVSTTQKILPDAFHSGHIPLKTEGSKFVHISCKSAVSLFNKVQLFLRLVLHEHIVNEVNGLVDNAKWVRLSPDLQPAGSFLAENKTEPMSSIFHDKKF